MSNNIRVIRPSGRIGVTVSLDTSGHYSELAKQWAISDAKVENIDYSAKYYASQASEAVNEAKDWAYKTDGKVDNEEYSAKYYAQQAASAGANSADINFSNITDAAKAVIQANSGASSGGGSWGSITGDLSDQTDLNTAISACAKSDLSNCTKPYIIETDIHSSYWYRKWSDGWLEQGGGMSITAATKGAVLYPLAFENATSYVPVITGLYEINAGSADAGGLWIYSRTAAMFRWVNDGPDGAMFWYACGPAAS